jgi:hypothetical protein
MKLSEFKSKLESLETLEFQLDNGQKVPSHFHITEVGMTTKKFTDCGNTFRIQKKATLQLWTSVDFWHKLDPKKIISIINSTNEIFDGEDLDIEVEYQQETIGKYKLEFVDEKFILTTTKTDCLAKDNCGIPIEKVKVKIGEWREKTSCCTPESGCC